MCIKSGIRGNIQYTVLTVTIPKKSGPKGFHVKREPCWKEGRDGRWEPEGGSVGNVAVDKGGRGGVTLRKRPKRAPTAGGDLCKRKGNPDALSKN